MLSAMSILLPSPPQIHCQGNKAHPLVPVGTQQRLVVNSIKKPESSPLLLQERLSRTQGGRSCSGLVPSHPHCTIACLCYAWVGWDFFPQEKPWVRKEAVQTSWEAQLSSGFYCAGLYTSRMWKTLALTWLQFEGTNRQMANGRVMKTCMHMYVHVHTLSRSNKVF